VPDLARKHDHPATEHVPGRHHGIQPGERVEAAEINLRFVWQALDRRGDVAKLQVLREEHAISLNGSAEREPRFESAYAGQPLSKTRDQVAWRRFPVVGAALRANLRHAGGEAAILCGKWIGEHLDGFDALSWQFEIELARRGVVQAGAADLQCALGRLSAFDAQPSVGPSNDPRKKRQEALEIVAFERSAFEHRAGKHVAHRDGLHAIGWRGGVCADLDIRHDERQLSVEQHL
jgi:hypothetical protein